MKARNKFFLSLITVAILTACNSSDSSSSESTPPPVADALPAIISGSVLTATPDSLTVNGHTLDLSNVNITYGDTQHSVNTLITGMNVRVATDGSQVTAVTLNPDLAGQVTHISETSITVGNVTVTRPSKADVSVMAFSQATATADDEPAIGDYVVVSTSLGENNTTHADAVVTLDNAPMYIELEGPISEFNAELQTFSLHGTQIDYASASLPEEALSDGLWVEVFGSYTDEGILAVKVEIESYDDDIEVEASGPITWVNAEQTRFELSRRMQFDVLSTTEFDDGTQQDLATGRPVEVEFKVVDGEPVLTEVEFDDQDDIAFYERGFSVMGNVTVEGNNVWLNDYAFTITSFTEFDDNLSADTLESNLIEFEGVERGEQFLIFEIERAENDGEVELEGLVQNGSMWGYSTDDNSLDSYEGQWVEVECQLNGMTLSGCQLDD